jgi:uncharacterized protein YuzE
MTIVYPARQGAKEQMMSKPSLEVSLDYLTGALYVTESDAKPVICDHAPNDMDIVLSLSSKKQIVGATILGASEINPADWFAHPDRAVLPDHLLKAIDEWFRNCSPAQQGARSVT